MKKQRKNSDFLPNRLNKYSIRKFTVGTASILVGASLLFGISKDAQAEENANVNQEITKTPTIDESPTEKEISEQSSNENTPEVPTKVTAQSPNTEKVSANTEIKKETESQPIFSEKEKASTPDFSNEVQESTILPEASISNATPTVNNDEVTKVPKTNSKVISDNKTQIEKTVEQQIDPSDNKETKTNLEKQQTTVKLKNTPANIDLDDAAKNLSEQVDKDRVVVATRKETEDTVAFMGTLYAAPLDQENYSGKIIDYNGDFVEKLDDPGYQFAPPEISFSPRFKDGVSKSFSFIQGNNGSVTKQLST